jgi:hypothetical protein
VLVDLVHDAAMKLLCSLGRHYWVTKQGKNETGQAESYQQCNRCGHYPQASHWSRGEGYEAPGGDKSSASAPPGY